MDLLEQLEMDTNATHLDKTAAIVKEYIGENISAQEADETAIALGIDPRDLVSIHGAMMEKTASEEQLDKEASEQEEYERILDTLIKVADDEDSTYLDKCSAVADLFAVGAIDGHEADDLSGELGLDPVDVNVIFESSYAEDLEKEAYDGPWNQMTDAERKAEGFDTKNQAAVREAGQKTKKAAGKAASYVSKNKKALLLGGGVALTAGELARRALSPKKKKD
jgi:hypothetical protein